MQAEVRLGAIAETDAVFGMMGRMLIDVGYGGLAAFGFNGYCGYGGYVGYDAQILRGFFHFNAT